MSTLFDPGWLIAPALLAEAGSEATSGGLFDFGGTLLLQIVQFLVLMVLLNAFFYRPISRVVEERSEYIRSNATSAQRRFDEAKALAEQYEQELRTVRLEAQQVIAKAEAEAQQIRAQQVSQAQAEAQSRIDAARAELDSQKQRALSSLASEVEAISRSLGDKLLNATGGRRGL
ncbi:F0F1 ATP synthase subunit B' [Gloeobacter kilaueensis]|uniref:ATP synthase subunit b' n=1 Tax=Gloeobacter kilaueensis (strain ATCC BAA-2537 / CCAP 1431/1 / ULC 316 / JS1) TaxID=1183438 RepID=U5QLD6_GLOK1|nr:F0F1 ATP synthase subunit B' [Gloeobacter kilaueensis]AGY58480.1 F0F1 ATP synthase subunit B' [Gloeobacter kilaueensis JS1]